LYQIRSQNVTVTLQKAMKTHRMSTGIALLILQRWHGHPTTGYENTQNEYRYSSTHSSTL